MWQNPADQRSRDEEQLVPPDYTAPIGPEDDEGFVPLQPDDSEEVVGPNPDVGEHWPGDPPPRATD